MVQSKGVLSVDGVGISAAAGQWKAFDLGHRCEFEMTGVSRIQARKGAYRCPAAVRPLYCRSILANKVVLRRMPRVTRIQWPVSRAADQRAPHQEQDGDLIRFRA